MPITIDGVIVNLLNYWICQYRLTLLRSATIWIERECFIKNSTLPSLTFIFIYNSGKSLRPIGHDIDTVKRISLVYLTGLKIRLI